MDAMEWVLGILAVIALWIAWAIVKRKVIVPRRKKARHLAWQNEERAEWLAKFNAADTDAKLAWLPAPMESWLTDEIAELYEKAKAAKVREQESDLAERTAQATAFYDQLGLLTDPRERWQLLTEAPYGPKVIDDGKSSLIDYVATGMKQYAKLLLQESREGNATSFYELAELATASEWESYGYHHNVGKKFKFPDDWDELVTTFYKNPSIKEFKKQPEYAPNEILLVATEALRTHSFVAAKLVLAYSMEAKNHQSGYGAHSQTQKYWPYRGAVGEILLTELAALVDGEHLKRGLFQEQKAATVVE